MSLAAAFVLALQPLPVASDSIAPIPRGTAVRTNAAAEILRAGRVGADAGPEDVVPQRRRISDGRIFAEFR
jgi:hypothetical protein